MMIILLVGVFAMCVYAHHHTAYSHESNVGGGNENWMADLCDTSQINDLSVPGTHDTMSDEGGMTVIDGGAVDTQSMDLPEQLAAGIRALDIRCKISYECPEFEPTVCFAIYHGSYFLNVFFRQVLNMIVSFLKAHPTEFVIMRIKNEQDDPDAAHKQKFIDILNYYVNHPQLSPYFYKLSVIPKVGEVRKKIVILRNFFFPGSWYLNWYDSGIFDIQDDYKLTVNEDLYGKWLKVKNQLHKANIYGNQNTGKFYVNFLSGSTGLFIGGPYFVASGHSDPATGAPRLSTGLTTPFSESSYPDFPRTTCVKELCLGFLCDEVCTISYEGTNILAFDHMNSLNFVGILMIDFPGKGLIDRIIGKNDYCKVCENFCGNWMCYYNNNVDLQAAFNDFSSTLDQTPDINVQLQRTQLFVRNHYITHGKREGRDCTCKTCDWQCYLDNYADLQAAFDSNLDAAKNHYYTHGVREGRDCTCKCNWQCYLDKYADLRKALGCNLDELKNHYHSFGKNEGRNCQCVAIANSALKEDLNIAPDDDYKPYFNINNKYKQYGALAIFTTLLILVILNIMCFLKYCYDKMQGRNLIKYKIVSMEETDTDNDVERN